MDEFKPLLKAVATGRELARDLTPEEAFRAFQMILAGGATDSQIGGFFVGERVKGETPEELAAFTRAALDVSHPFQTRVAGLLDVAAPYDGKIKSPWVLIPASLIAVACGARLLLHGEPGMPPKRGVAPADVLEELGIPTSLERPEVEELVHTVGFGYFGMRQFSPKVWELKRIRLEINFRPFISAIEKLWNPGRAERQLVGGYHGPYVDKIAQTLRLLNSKSAWVVQGMEGSPEMRVTRATRVVEVGPEGLSSRMLLPKDLGIGDALGKGQDPLMPDADAKKNAAWTLSILKGEADSFREIALLNASLILVVSGKAGSWPEALDRSTEALASGRALETLEALRAQALKMVAHHS